MDDFHANAEGAGEEQWQKLDFVSVCVCVCVCVRLSVYKLSQGRFAMCWRAKCL